MSLPIGTIGVVDTLTVGGRQMVNPSGSGLITLVAHTGTNSRSTFRKPSATSGYQVTSGKTLTIVAWLAINNTGTATNPTIAQTDNDVGLDSNTAFTTPIYLGGGTLAQGAVSVQGNTTLPFPAFTPNFPVLATKYFSIDTGSNVNTTYVAYGYEA